MLELGDLGIEGFRNAGMLEYWDAGIWECWDWMIITRRYDGIE